MTRHQLGSILAKLAAVGFLATAWLHSTGYSSVTALAADVPSELGPLMPALWLAFSLDLAILGLIIAVVAYHLTATGRLILVIAAFSPLGAAALQLRFLGFVAPTAILLTLAAVTFAAAAVAQPESAQRAT